MKNGRRFCMLNFATCYIVSFIYYELQKWLTTPNNAPI